MTGGVPDTGSIRGGTIRVMCGPALLPGLAGTGQEEPPAMTSTPLPAGELTVTERLLRTAAPRGARRALVGGPGDGCYTYARLATAVQSAAAGLAWRGVQARDVVGVYVQDAVSYVLSVHAIRAAGGVPAPVSVALTVQEIAGQLAECGARMLLTTPPLAAAALAAADRSWVRQVICFGEAPGTIPFCSLLQLGSLPPAQARRHDLALLPYPRQPDGSLGPAGLTHDEYAGLLGRLAAQADLAGRDVLVTAPPDGDGREYTLLLDNALLQGATVVAAGPGGQQAGAAAGRTADGRTAGGREAGVTAPGAGSRTGC